MIKRLVCKIELLRMRTLLNRQKKTWYVIRFSVIDTHHNFTKTSEEQGGIKSNSEDFSTVGGYDGI